MGKPVYLAKLEHFWCEKCNVPLLGDRCNKCGSSGRKIEVTPPGDIRPAFDYDIDLMRKVFDEDYGNGIGNIVIPPDKIILLNNAPSIDKMDEIIVDGKVIASVQYSLQNSKFKPRLRLESAALINKAGGKKWVRCDSGAGDAVLEGKNLLSPGVTDVEGSIKKGDEVYVLNHRNEVIALGIAYKNANEMQNTKGLAVKIRRHGFPSNISAKPGQDWKDVIDANENVLEREERRAKKFAKNVIENVNRDVCVAFSGGKDSLVTLNIVREVCDEEGLDLSVLFVDTGLEFPETLKYTENLLRDLEVDVKTKKSDEFWRAFSKFGPPGRDYRWCCKTCKLGPMTTLIKKHFPRGCLTFVGQRKYESENRARQSKIWKNPWVPGQIGASPIFDWSALQVWLYIFWKGLRYNPLYENGFERIGCWMCPSSDMAEFRRVIEIHPDLWEKWDNLISKWSEERGYSKEWYKFGFWRWQKLPKSQLAIAKELNVDIKPKKVHDKVSDLKLVSGLRPCLGEKKISIEGSFNTALDIEKTANLMNCIAKPILNKDLGIVMIRWNGNSAWISRNGNVVIRGYKKEELKEVSNLIAEIVYRSIKCVSCGICSGKCKENAIFFKDGSFWIDEKRCKHCMECLNNCPVTKYAPVI
ncbi:MAG: phosphoadenosine phosphosulfate reductase family protein [Candidatus Hydrothermarchaeota archaeon]